MKSLSLDLPVFLCCHHRDQSRVFTIHNRTYKVCFDCGREFDMPSAQTPKRLDNASTARLGTSTRRAG